MSDLLILYDGALYQKIDGAAKGSPLVSFYFTFKSKYGSKKFFLIFKRHVDDELMLFSAFHKTEKSHMLINRPNLNISCTFKIEKILKYTRMKWFFYICLL